MVRRISVEEKIAERIEKLINDLTVDIEQLGIYLARTNNITYRRLQEIAESAKYEKEETDVHHY
jgi:hypothetical protein